MTMKSNSIAPSPRSGRSGFLSSLAGAPAIRKLQKLPRSAWITALFVLLAAAGVLAYYQGVYLPAQASAEEPAMQTATVRQGDLVVYATGTGTLISANEISLAFEAGGQITGLYFEVGDKVKAGDKLAAVDDSEAQIAYAQARRALMELTSPSAVAEAMAAMAEAETAIVTAQSHLQYVISPSVYYWELEVDKAQAAVDSAQAAINTPPSNKEAQAALETAKERLAYLQDKLTGAWLSYEKSYLPNTFTTTDRETGKKYVAAPSQADILSARAELASAEAALEEAQALYAALTGVEVPEDATGSGLSELEQAQLDLQSAQDALDGTCLYAPFDGTVMSIDVNTGDMASSGTAVITVADLDHPYLDLYLDESDWANVDTGYEVEVTFDILPERTFTGTVTQVDPGLVTDNGSNAVHAVVRLTGIDQDNFNLPLGTSASVDVIGGRAENAILVPVEALHQAGDQYTVFVVENGEPRLRVVEVGLMDSLYAQILSGLEPGEIVTTGITETE